MNLPNESQWDRVEQLADEIAGLGPDEIARRLSELGASGESPAVLTLLRAWVSLPPVAQPFRAGDKLGGRYTLLENLGEGGMGSVWRARQDLIDRDVALKIIHPSLVTPDLKARFEAEMRILGQLKHPGIIDIIDAGLHQPPDGAAIPFFTMELIDGPTLDRWAAARRKFRVELLRVAAEICFALGSAHEHQIVHRDLKPSNILVRKDGQPVVLDFGIARLRGLVLGEEEGAFSGTPQYAAPEQHLGRDHDFRSGESVDIYAVGVILFEVLTGRKLFEFERGASIEQIRRAVVEGSNRRLSNFLPECPLALDEIVSRAIRRDPADRYYSIASLGRAIHRVAREISSPKAVSVRWTPAARASIPGTSWILLEKLGQGGAGEVWIGVHKQLGERRVFKFCSTEENARTLKREVTLFRLLKERTGRNPHFITLHEVSLDEEPWYLMMDYVDARDLTGWCSAQPGGLVSIPEGRRIEILAQTAEALQAAHDAGILHRDVKPANLLVRENAEGNLHVFVADFGIGHIVTDQVLRDKTRLGFTRTVSGIRRDTLAGTLLYLAPEILEGGSATVRSDIYSLGVVFWQLLIGNLNAALDPVDWPSRIEDPILRDTLHRCLAGSPSRRWASAGELASRLRALPDLRAAEERRRAEIRKHEAAAFRRGMLRTAGISGVILVVIAGLAVFGWIESRSARRAQGAIALEQAQTLYRSDLSAGRRDRGMKLLSAAVGNVTDRTPLRSAAASVFGLTDLLKAPVTTNSGQAPPVSQFPRQEGEVCRTVSPGGETIAIARDLDGLNGAIDLVDTASEQVRLTLTRQLFPWVPIAERGLLRFSPVGTLLAVGGAATSRHVLLFDTRTGALRSYLYHSSDAISCAWHPGGRLFATGSADGKVRVWDTALAIDPRSNASTQNQFDVPPALDVPALDQPLFPLQGQRDRVDRLVFHPGGKWLAALDRAGYLRVFSGFPGAQSFSAEPPGDKQPGPAMELHPPILAIEARIDPVDNCSELVSGSNSIVVCHAKSPPEEFRLVMGGLPDELPLGADPIHVCWNSQGTTLCVLSLTDGYWLTPVPLNIVFHSRGINADGVGWNEAASSWCLPRGDKLGLYQPGHRAGELLTNALFSLEGVLPGQGAVTSLASANDGRTAVYHGRRIQFYRNKAAAPRESSVIADGAGGRFQDLRWDTGGRLLGAIFAQSNGTLRVESWKTSDGFPPRCSPVKPITVESERIVEENDSSHFVARGTRHGLEAVEVSTGAHLVLDGSASACQNAALACSPDGAFLAMVVDRNVIRLLRLPSGAQFADLHSPRPLLITELCWDRAGARLTSLTDDGYLQVWDLGPWRQWLREHHLDL